GEIRVRVVIPSTSGETFPLLVFFHGGGFMAGDINTNDYELRVLSYRLKIVTVNVDYRLDGAPHAQDDSYAALKWAAANDTTLSADTTKGFIVMGASAGGQIAAVTAQRARDDPFFNRQRLTGQIIQIPSVCHLYCYPEQYKDRLLSMEQNKDAPMLSKQAMVNIYRFLGGDPKDPSISPLLTPSLVGLPPALVQVAGLDPLRDEGILYGELLRGASVNTRIEVYSGVPHGFQYVMSTTEKAKKFTQDVEDAVRWMTSV
ncbi:Alpha/Beta hydrolase protein, partial [Vararia minispora EC-137]